MTRTGARSSAIARMAQTTAAPPAMSSFIRSMPSAGLIEIPPVSKVMPFPTSPSTGDLGASTARASSRARAVVPRCRARRRAAGPCRAVRLRARRALRRGGRRPSRSARARSAKTRGVSTFDGSLLRLRARLAESPRMRPRSTAFSSAAAVVCPSAVATIISSAGGPMRSPVL